MKRARLGWGSGCTRLDSCGRWKKTRALAFAEGFRRDPSGRGKRAVIEEAVRHPPARATNGVHGS